jgi:chitinase
MTNPTLKAVDKALSDPKSVIQDLASFNGQKCFKYQGDCVNLNDNNAMAKACTSGYTVVGWDDAGCGKSSCVGPSSNPFPSSFSSSSSSSISSSYLSD